MYPDAIIIVTIVCVIVIMIVTAYLWISYVKVKNLYPKHSHVASSLGPAPAPSFRF
jgi:Zn-dependent membrane protease YugP